ncbi:hypothetical protein L916_01821, partial [Phytophthora nicotianae]
MPGLRAEELPSERLSVGEQIAYYSRRFVTGDTRGQRVAVVMSVDDTPENELPVSLDAGDSLLLTVFMRRSHDVLGNEINLEHVKWRKLASCHIERLQRRNCCYDGLTLRDESGQTPAATSANEQPVRVCTPGDGADESVLPADKTTYPTMSGVLQRVPSRRRRQPVFLQPREDKDHAPVEVDWPKDVVKIYNGYTIFYSMRSTKNKFVIEAVKAGSITLFISQRSSQTLRSLSYTI